MRRAHSFFVTILLITNLHFCTDGQIVFNNPNFEDDTNCDLNDCELTELSCISGWYNFYEYSSVDDFSWMYYDDYFLCDSENHVLESCGGERGIRVSESTGSGKFYPSTQNPFFNLDMTAAYEILFSANIFEIVAGGPYSRIQVYGSDVPYGLIGSATLIQTSNSIPVDGICHQVKIGIINPEKVEILTSSQYLMFKIVSSSIPVDPESVIITGVLDDFSACKLLDMDIYTSCDQLCIDFSTDCDPECVLDPILEPEEEDCYISVVWCTTSNASECLEEDCYIPYVGDAQCCITPPGNGTYYGFVDVLYTIDGETEYQYYNFEVDFQPCSTATIATNTTWYAQDIDPLVRFELITVQSGKTLTIMNDLTLQFCETGKLVINPGGKVILNGVLTSDCNDGWLGVEVQGNGSTNQYPSLGLYPQGQLYCNPDSRIENAKTAAKLYGPDYDDAGGMIFAEGADFINNSRGLDFAPFHNFFPTTSTQKHYQSTVRDCQFNIKEDYDIPWAFIEHIKLNGIFGISINGTFLGYERTISGAFSPKQFGTGIKAINSGFSVGATAIDPEEEPCLPPCDEYNRSKFYGLGIGISAGKFLQNRPFQVYNSEFENCFFGIANENVSGANILFNDFIMGRPPELTGDENQVGISMSGYQMLGAIQENSFVATEGNADFTLGIASNNIGEMNNAIRRNTYDGLSVGNEAFHRNAQEEKVRFNTGLNYICNTNSNVELFDFIVLLADQNNNFIRHQQTVLNQPTPVATGNTFSRTGDIDFGDFANFGEREIDYFQDNTEADEILEDFTDLTIEPLNIGFSLCEPEYCLHPCLEPEDLSSEIGRYYYHMEEYLDAVNEHEFEDAVVFLSAVHENLSDITRFMEFDTTGFNRDTLRKWYRRYGGVTGELLLAGDYFDAGLSTPAGNTIDSISIRHTLGSDQVLDIVRVGRIYDILSARTVYSLTSTDIDSLNVFAQAYGASYSLARSILPLIDTVYTPRYYIPGELTPRSTSEGNKIISAKTNIRVYPNPVFHSIFVDLPEEYTQPATFELFDVTGYSAAQFQLNYGLNNLDLSQYIDLTSSVYLYRIYSMDKMLSSGKIIIIN
jgi:hypothetical protein